MPTIKLAIGIIGLAISGVLQFQTLVFLTSSGLPGLSASLYSYIASSILIAASIMIIMTRRRIDSRIPALFYGGAGTLMLLGGRTLGSLYLMGAVSIGSAVVLYTHYNNNRFEN